MDYDLAFLLYHIISVMFLDYLLSPPDYRINLTILME